MKFFFIREEVIPVDMEFRQSAPIPKEDIKVLRGVAWYEKLLALPYRVFGEQVLVVAGMSDKWSEQSKDVPMLLFDGQEVALYQSAFPAFSGTMGMRPLRGGKEYWFEHIKPNFMYARAELFAAPPAATEGARYPNPRPCRAMTPAGKEIVYLSSEESLHSSEHELKPSCGVFAGVLCDLGVEHEEKRLKRPAKKKVTVSNAAATAGSAGSKGTDSGATPTFVHVEETEAEPEAEKLVRKNASKRSRADTGTETTPPAKNAATGKHNGKKASLRSHYSEFSPEVHVKDTTAGGGSTGGSGATARKDNSRTKKPRSLSPIRAEDMLGDKYYKTYDESHANELHAPVWNLKQSDTFSEFGASREWMMGAFPRGEVRHQKDRGHDHLYRSYIYAEANASSTSHQIAREWRTIYLERSGWEKHRKRLATEAKLFEQAQAKFQEEKVAFEKEKKSEEWGLQGLKLKLQASEDTLAEERQKWRVACKNDNKKMYIAHTKITNLEARVEEFKKSEAD
ncbi:hypothetical protein HanOQP8_Chr16g0638461 [Helianthus annuus]|nr:hypothetical protein HanHA89_Chr16g0683751 [Helianthus annuus]KAJ0646735.1 hypothetical protein HanOQP8_Chr16g0638461 [Helianthus annuus]KAJ0823479.1 hypothetical protein HanPSC8_Chr16g0744211 [Helianthus annuus]